VKEQIFTWYSSSLSLNFATSISHWFMALLIDFEYSSISFDLEKYCSHKCKNVVVPSDINLLEGLWDNIMDELNGNYSLPPPGGYIFIRVYIIVCIP
jgi:hypothetical protein